MQEIAGLLLSALLAAALAPRALGDFADNGWVRCNYQGRELPFPAGAIAVGVSLVALAPLAVAQEATDTRLLSLPALALGLGIAFLGLLDDVLDAPARGMRGHARAVLRGGFSTGVLKAVGTLAVALAVLGASEREPLEYLLAVAVLVLATNAFNLLDLRPGRAAKAFVLLALALLAGTRELEPLRDIGVLAGPLLVLGVFDLRERAMLGDTGSNLLGALAGLWIVTALDVTGQLVALVALVALTAFGELRSISRAIEAVTPLRALDRLGRPRDGAGPARADRASSQGASEI